MLPHGVGEKKGRLPTSYAEGDLAGWLNLALAPYPSPAGGPKGTCAPVCV
jgi:hypothetical protein